METFEFCKKRSKVEHTRQTFYIEMIDFRTHKKVLKF